MTNQSLILVIDPEPGYTRLLKLELTQAGFHVITATDPNEALKLIEKQKPDLVTSEVIFPEMNYFDLLRKIRERNIIVPIIFLTSRDHDMDEIAILNLGADDYLRKPFNPEVLSARIRAVLRRVKPPEDRQVIHFHDLVIDFDRRKFEKKGERIYLTRTEWLLLHELALNRGKVMLYSELLSRLWGTENNDNRQYLRVWINRLRRKIEDNPSKPTIIQTYVGIGYEMVDNSSEKPI